jgi:GNAT superfamily N-acetyltransferase
VHHVSASLDVAAVPATSPLMPGLAELFGDYRRHYGQPDDADWSRAWLGDQLASGALRGYLARRDGEPAGMALVAPTPASQGLGHFWQLRDLYVAERHRREGVGHALVAHIRDAALAAGALRVSLTTEADNVRALALYGDLGFEPVHGYVSLSLDTGRRP